MMTVNRFIKTVANYHGEHVFNPYADHCPLTDRFNAASIRRGNLSRTLKRLQQAKGIEALWIGRDLGYRGGRRTGLPFTDDVQLAAAAEFWDVKLAQPTKGAVIAERSSGNIWSQLLQTQSTIFTWNIFPFHPFEPGKPLSNRSHNSLERDEGLVILSQLIALLQPKSLVAIGNEAFHGCNKVFDPASVVKVRHPSYGGEKIFRSQIAELYRY